MSLLLFSASGRVVAGGAASVQTVEAQLVNYTGASGEQRVSSGFPLPPGLVTDAMVAARQISVLNASDTEVACNVTALRGRHQDGSVRSIEVQFLHTFGDAAETPVSGFKVVVGRTRLTTDIAYVPLTYQRFFDPCVLLATDPAYLCQTWVTAQPLLPDADADATSAEWFQTFFDFLALDPIDIGGGLQPGRLQDRDNGVTAHYAHPRGLAARFCKTGTPHYWRWANKRFTGQNPLGDNTENLDTQTRGFYWTRIATAATGWTGASAYNPEGITQAAGSSEALEQFRFTVMDFPTMYWLSGYGFLWNSIANMAMRAASQTASNTEANVALGTYVASTDFGFRFNTSRAAVWLAAYLMDATGQTPVGTQYSGGISRATPTDLRSLIAWSVEAWDRNRWDATKGAYREGLRGARQTAADGAKLTDGSDYEGTLPLFQIAAASYVMIDIYLSVADHVDPITAETTKHRIRDNLNAVIRCTRRLTAGDGGQYNQGPAGLDKWGITYNMTPTPGEGWTYNADPATNVVETFVSPNLLPMFLRAAAFCAHFFPSDTVTDLDGVSVTYAQYYARLADPDVLRNSVTYDIQYAWKTFGEYFGFQMDCDYFVAEGVPAAPASPRANTDYADDLWSHT